MARVSAAAAVANGWLLVNGEFGPKLQSSDAYFFGQDSETRSVGHKSLFFPREFIMGCY